MLWLSSYFPSFETTISTEYLIVGIIENIIPQMYLFTLSEGSRWKFEANSLLPVTKIAFDALRQYVHQFCESFISHNAHVPVSCASKVLPDRAKPHEQRLNKKEKNEEDIPRALIVPSIIITKHGKSDAKRVIIFYTWQPFPRWEKSRQKPNEITLAASEKRETITKFYYIIYLMLRLRAAEG